MVAIFLADGFEEIEALATVDILKRAGIDTKTVSIKDNTVVGAHGIRVIADSIIDETEGKDFSAIMLPGGMPGTANLLNCEKLRNIIVSFNEQNKPIFAICAAPMILGEMGILENKNAICYPSFEEHLKGAEISDKSVCADGNIITGKGPGVTFEFAYKIVSFLKSSEIADKLKEEMQYEK